MDKYGASKLVVLLSILSLASLAAAQSSASSQTSPADLAPPPPPPPASSGSTASALAIVSQGFSTATLYRNAAIVTTTTATFLSLCNAVAGQRGAARLNVPPVYFPTIRFRLFIGGGTGGDGLAFSYGAGIPDNLTPALEGASGSAPAVGFGNNLIVSFKSKTDSNGPAGLNIYFNGVSNTPDITVPVSVRNRPWLPVTIAITNTLEGATDAAISVALNNTWVVANQTIASVWNPTSSWGWVFSGSSSQSATDLHRIDSLVISMETIPDVSMQLAFSDDTAAPVSAYQGPAYDAASNSARGPQYAIRLLSSPTRGPIRRMRRMIRQSTTTGVVVSIGFYNAAELTAYEMALNVAYDICMGTYSAAAQQLMGAAYAGWTNGVPPRYISVTFQSRLLNLNGVTSCATFQSLLSTQWLYLRTPVRSPNGWYRFPPSNR